MLLDSALGKPLPMSTSRNWPWQHRLVNRNRLSSPLIVKINRSISISNHSVTLTAHAIHLIGRHTACFFLNLFNHLLLLT